MPVLTGGQVLDREGTTVMPDWGGALLEGGLYNVGDHGLIEEAEEPVMGMGPYRYSGVPADGYKNGIAEKGAYLVDILTGDTYRNTGTKAATVWTADAPSGGGSGPQMSDPITISSADLLALDTVRKQVLAAPGVGFVRLVLWVAYRMVPGATPYTIDPSEGIAMRYGAGGATAGPFLDGEVILAATAPFLSTMIGTGYGDLLSAFEDQPITLVATGPITAGDGQLVLTLGYQDVPVA